MSDTTCGQLHQRPVTSASNNNRITLIIVYSRCGLCQQAVLLDSDDIAHHLKKCHSITHKEYNSKLVGI